mmetsp:Transcript_64016/g.116815  ORF Transcript_64016/g.116815 Transcript_64016/m.116815 type:complete len:276 (+) Transcript_64016:119-946(+)
MNSSCATSKSPPFSNNPPTAAAFCGACSGSVSCDCCERFDPQRRPPLPAPALCCGAWGHGLDSCERVSTLLLLDAVSRAAKSSFSAGRSCARMAACRSPPYGKVAMSSTNEVASASVLSVSWFSPSPPLPHPCAPLSTWRLQRAFTLPAADDDSKLSGPSCDKERLLSTDAEQLVSAWQPLPFCDSSGHGSLIRDMATRSFETAAGMATSSTRKQGSTCSLSGKTHVTQLRPGRRPTTLSKPGPLHSESPCLEDPCCLVSCRPVRTRQAKVAEQP